MRLAAHGRDFLILIYTDEAFQFDGVQAAFNRSSLNLLGW